MLITHCPECATAFRVSVDQLEAREGRVRCGRCRAVFNARESLSVELDVPVQAAALRREPESAPASEAPAAPQPVSGTAPLAAPQPVPGTGPLAAPGPAPQAITAAAPPYEPEFGPEKKRGSMWWWPVSVLALLALAAQLAFYFRGELALVYPESKPLLTDLCEQLGCEVPLPRRAELMSIESSDLQADSANPGVMVLTATLRNRAAFPQGYPALELTLTDDKDRAVARRVLVARDYLVRGASLEAGFGANSEIPVRISIEAVGIKPTGYRLYLFYP